MESEFFLDSRISDGTLTVPNRQKGQPDVPKSLANAVAEYILLMRNSTHGFRRTFEQRADLLALFSAHTGVMPDVVSDIPWTHLLRMLADPERALNNVGLRPRVPVDLV